VRPPASSAMIEGAMTPRLSSEPATLLRVAVRAAGALLLVTGLGTATVRAAPDPGPSIEARAGLGNVRQKLEAGEAVTIAFVGGSITALPGWRDGLMRDLRSKYAGATIEGLNAGLSATGSDVAVARLDEEVLVHQPDLVVLEFAVNDAGGSGRVTRAAVEGMVRKIWSADPRTDILFLYLFDPRFEADLAAGRLPPSMQAHEKVAAHHGIPSIDAASVVMQLHRDGVIRLEGDRVSKPGEPRAFAPDGVHPYRYGHRIYERAVSRGLEAIFSVSTPRDHGPELERPLMTDHWQAAHQVPLAEWMRDEHWRRSEAGEAASRAIELWEATAPGAAIEFGFKGSVLKIYELREADPGALEIRVDGEPLRPDSFRRLNPGPRLRVLHVRRRFDPDSVHRISIRAVPVEGAEEFRPVRLGDLLVLGEVVR